MLAYWQEVFLLHGDFAPTLTRVTFLDHARRPSLWERLTFRAYGWVWPEDKRG